MSRKLRRFLPGLKPVTLLLLALAGVPARAQPIDVMRMSGIPRPDAQTPQGTIVVRLIRGELSNRMTGVEVELRDSAGGVKVAKTDAEGRATFSGLAGGPFQARASDRAGEEVRSQPIELPSGMGVRVMLVFAAGGPGTSDGVARPDKSIPPHTVVVRALDAAQKPLAGLEVVVGHARAGETRVSELKGKTNAKGEARFEELDAKPSSGYLAEVLKDGARFSSKPFRLSENMGSLVVLEIRPVSHELGSLALASGSHFIIQVMDDAVQVVEVIRLENGGDRAVDPGPAGLHLPLPEHALSAQVGPQSPPSFTIEGHDAVWKGPIPTGMTGGDIGLQMIFVLAYKGDRVELKQRMPLGLSGLAMVIEKIEGIEVQGPQLERQDRELGGRKFVLVRGPGTPPGGTLELTLTGLPHANPGWRYLAGAVTVLILLGFGIYAATGRSSEATRRRHLESRRRHLLDELVALESKNAENDPRHAKKREELAGKLAEVYKELDVESEQPSPESRGSRHGEVGG